jgi:hypothetical protein
VDLVDEQDVALLERRQDRRQIALALERRPGDRPNPDAELLAEDVGEARLAEAGGPTSSTWSRASPRVRAASSAISSCSFTRACPTKSSKLRGRRERSTSSS